MKFTLIRGFYDADGIFGTLSDDNDVQVSVTLEHAYDARLGDGSYVPKVAPGVYTCTRHAPNRLPYETWELQNVPDFQGQPVAGILIHVGNYDKDSEGCILLGTAMVNGNMVTSSKTAFDKFMAITAGLTSIVLEIK